MFYPYLVELKHNVWASLPLIGGLFYPYLVELKQPQLL